jgi:hypothetical protein
LQAVQAVRGEELVEDLRDVTAAIGDSGQGVHSAGSSGLPADRKGPGLGILDLVVGARSTVGSPVQMSCTTAAEKARVRRVGADDRYPAVLRANQQAFQQQVAR